jgi:Tfp pilus assembly protein PilN
MPSINMIATRREEKRRFQQYTHKLVYAIIAEIGVVVLLLSFMVVRLVEVKGQITDLEGQIGGLQPKVNQIQSLEAQTAALKPKVGTLNGARNNTLYWYTALQTVVASLPEKSWLTSIATTGDPTPPPATPAASSAAKPTAPTLPGAALNFAGIAMLKMNQFQNISSVTLSYINSAAGPQGGGNSGMSFSMNVDLKPNTTGEESFPGISTFVVPPPSGVIPTPGAPTAQTNPVRQAQADTSTPLGGESHVEKS